MKYILSLLLLTLSGLILAQEKLDSVGAIILDADTGEPIQYASVYVSPNCGTISNDEGEFCLQCLPSETVRITCIGYKRITFQASKLPSVIRMESVSTMLNEVTITRGDNLIYKLVEKMQREAKKHKKAESQYFFRMAIKYPGTDELAEAFMSAKSCVQIRDIIFHSGSRGQLQDGKVSGPSLTGLGRTNLHVFLRLSPVLVNYDIWGNAFVPADFAFHRIKDVYDISCVKLTEEDGTEINKIRFSAHPAIISHPVLDGTLYVDRKRCRLLRFDGQMHGLQIVLYDQARDKYLYTSVNYTMHVDYRHDHGFTEISNMSDVITKDSVKIRQLLYNLGDKKLQFKNSVRVGKNMIHAIDMAGFDSTLWVANNIVKRTKEEERVVFKDTTFWSTNISKYDTEVTEQEKNTNIYLKDAVQKLMGNTMQLQRTLPNVNRRKKK